MRNVLIAEADDLTLRARGDELLLDGYEVIAAQTDHAARTKLAEPIAHALILGALQSPAHSLRLLRDLRAGDIPGADTHLPVLSTGADNDHQAVRHYQAGSDIALPSSASPAADRRRPERTHPSPRQPAPQAARRRSHRRRRRAHRDHQRPTHPTHPPRV